MSGVIVTGNFFDLLGITARTGPAALALGRCDTGRASGRGDQPSLWQNRFAGEPDIVGSEVRLNGGVFTIVGVAPRDFPGRNSA